MYKVNWYFLNMFLILMLILFLASINDDRSFYRFLDDNNITSEDYYYNRTIQNVTFINFTNINIENITKEFQGHRTIQYPKGEVFKDIIVNLLVVLLIMINVYYLIKWIMLFYGKRKKINS